MEDVPWGDLLHALETWLHNQELFGVGAAFLGALVFGWMVLRSMGPVIFFLGGGILLAVGLLALAVAAWILYEQQHPVVSSRRRRVYMYC